MQKCISGLFNLNQQFSIIILKLVKEIFLHGIYRLLQGFRS